MDKFIVVINGRGGVGKDTLCDLVAQKYPTMNVSSIDPIKEIAKTLGWNGEKDEKGRKFLADLKKAAITYDPAFSVNYLIDKVKEFYTSDDHIMFVHIREPKEIMKFELAAEKLHTLNNNVVITDLLIKRKEIDTIPIYGNTADDGVNNYHYDHTYYNNTTLDEARIRFIKWFEDNCMGYSDNEDNNMDKVVILY